MTCSGCDSLGSLYEAWHGDDRAFIAEATYSYLQNVPRPLPREPVDALFVLFAAPNNLRGCNNDVSRMRRAWRAVAAANGLDNMVIRTLRPGEGRPQPTGGAIRSALVWMADAAVALEARVVGMHISAHGVQRSAAGSWWPWGKRGDRGERDGKDECVLGQLSYDSASSESWDYVRDNEVARMLANIDSRLSCATAEGEREHAEPVVALFTSDTCHSQGFFEQPYAYHPAKRRFVADRRDVDAGVGTLENVRCVAITGCAAAEESYEKDYPGGRSGHLTYFLSEEIASHPERLTLGDVLQVRERVQEAVDAMVAAQVVLASGRGTRRARRGRGSVRRGGRKKQLPTVQSVGFSCSHPPSGTVDPEDFVIFSEGRFPLG